MAPSILSQSVAVLARATYAVHVEDSLSLAARRMRENGGGILALIRDGRYAGAITERSLAEALAKGMEPLDPAVRAQDVADLRIASYITGAEALRLFSELEVPALVVVDERGHVMGVLSPSDLYPRTMVPPRPPMIGGMATPFGVYLTTGVVRAGASDLALVTTGMLLCCILLVTAVIATQAANWAAARGMSEDVASTLATVLQFGLFGAVMRFLPIAKIHAAEHKTIHAIERGEELNLEVVRRMPRVHPRCGTNFAVGAAIFLTIATTPLISIPEIRVTIALLATLIFWRPLGAVVQHYITTAPPKDKHLRMGIRSGEELLAKFADAHVVMPTLGQRIYASGLLHVALGSAIISGVAYLVARALHIDFV